MIEWVLYYYVVKRRLIMKKIFFAFIIVLLMFTVNLSAQAKPFTGYDKAAWGVSEQSVRQLYSIRDDVTAKANSDDSNITILKQDDVSDSIYKREFYFIGDKLYRTWKKFYNEYQSSKWGL
jgi:hypothetical protein